MVRVVSSDLEPYLAGLFEAVGLQADDAAVVARSYVTAELAGLASHGVMRIPRIFAGIDAGTHFPSHLPSTVREGVAFAVLDGRSAAGSTSRGLCHEAGGAESPRRRDRVCGGIQQQSFRDCRLLFAALQQSSR